jgi:hypothetical protein
MSNKRNMPPDSRLIFQWISLVIPYSEMDFPRGDENGQDLIVY